MAAFLVVSLVWRSGRAQDYEKLEFPQAVYTVSIAIADDECKASCRVFLFYNASDFENVVREFQPSATLVFTGLKPGPYCLDVNCSSADSPLGVCQAEPHAIEFQAMDEAPSGVISVGSLGLALTNSSNAFEPPQDMQQQQQPSATVSKWQTLAIAGILALQWIGLRVITAFTNKSSSGTHVCPSRPAVTCSSWWQR
ncbi:uncharacterized protein LOC112341124 [Selaginella moellendorffii]|uniref:uncharacterized protein LOC112341124 n=1 Tax=Selaginella moellendorffii TaxID=88036 RepID=UPI000D1CE395|nr:uncharacterized protein LOC112341124 [Selaginella moellendorffii]|eukprot:XP_024516463.1 uncharacterized protein LOC112341124 [Selaginella moellendorffii]